MTETQFKKGQKSGPGRPKGSENKMTKEVKTMILEALEEAGGVDYLVNRANDPRTASAFLTLVGKVLPMQIVGEMTMRTATDLKDDELAAIASGSGG